MENDYKQALNRGLNHIGDAPQENPLMSLMRDYVKAKENFDQACRNQQQVNSERQEAEKRLLALSEKVTQVVQQGVYDPTAAPCPQPTNSGVLGQSRY